MGGPIGDCDYAVLRTGHIRRAGLNDLPQKTDSTATRMDCSSRRPRNGRRNTRVIGWHLHMFDDISSVALHSAASALSERGRVTADNIANIQTPGFLANRVMFEDALADAVDGGSGATDPSVATSLEPTRLDGNNVNLDRETLTSVDTNLRYQMITQAMTDKFMILSSAMK